MQRNNRGQNGFSLIEVAILLIVIGIVTTPMIMAYNGELIKARMNETRSSFSDVKSAINLFIAANGRYPRPASLNTVEGDADFGEEGANLNPPLCTAATWFTTDGYCETPGSSRVFIGAVPFGALGLDPQAGEDYWNNKIIYAVTRDQTDAALFSQAITAGQITIRSYESIYNGATDAWDRLPPANFSSNFDMVLISTGETAIGGYSNQANLIEACDTAPATNESENCDFDSTFFLDKHPEPSFRNTGARVSVPGITFYDDLTDQQNSFPLTTWFENIFDPTYVMSLSDRIGIGTNNPAVRVDVIGNIRAGDNGAPRNITAEEVCDNASNCFEPELIGGNRPQMDCRENGINAATALDREPIIEIGNSQVYCGAAVDGAGNEIDPAGRGFQFPSTFTGTRCIDTGQLMTGIDSTGAVTCASP